ncbi:MAG: histidinol dehydrogenase [Saprospiraceae bacterium]|nr:histidinol dehydrogenase [Saprospiraceae bacterium]
MSLSIPIYDKPDQNRWPEIARRPDAPATNVAEIVRDIMQKVENKGDEAVKEYTSQFDGITLEHLWVKPEEIESARAELDDALKAAIDQAKENIHRFHLEQLQNTPSVETMPGVVCWRETRAIERVGLYIPGGTAPLFSTILMLAIPAQIAGCQEVVICTPPQKHGKVHPAMRYAALISGVSKIYKAGGAQAIAAMTYGTATMPPVQKIFGPGNHFVTEAKLSAQRRGVAIDMPAGPSEVLVLADSSADPNFVAADLISQAEHGVDSQAVLVSTSWTLLQKVQSCIQDQLNDLPRREIAVKSLANSMMIFLETTEQAFEFSNLYAPEHLIVSVADPHTYLPLIQNAGSVFVGNFSPESAGDYASGTNHTLPTDGWASSYSGVSVESFVKKITFQELTPEGLLKLAPTVEVMAKAEQLVGHQRAVEIRRKSLER